MHRYVFKALLYIDILLQSLIWRDPGVTVSTRCGLALRRGAPWGWCVLGRALNWVSPNHCENAIRNDISRAKAVLEILK